MKKHARLVLALLPALLVFSAAAQDKVIAASPSSLTALDLYAQPGATTPDKQVSVADAGLPLAIQATQAGYHQVTIGGQPWWLRGMQVRVSRAAPAGCATAKHSATVATIATPGAGTDACK